MEIQGKGFLFMRPGVFIFLFSFLVFLRLDGGVSRVVSLCPALTELICHLGKEGLLAGRSDVCNFPESVKKLPVAGRFAQPYVEKLLALKPDLLVTNDLVNPGIAAALKKGGIRTLRLPCRNLEEYKKCVTVLGRELGAEKAAAAETARIDAWVKRKRKKLDMRVLWVVWDMPLMTPGKRSHLHEIIGLAGAENATGEFDLEYLRPSFDALLKTRIDAIVWSASSSGWKERRVWRQFPAVKRGHVLHGFDQDVLLRPGPRMLRGIEWLRSRLEGWRRP